MRDHDKYEAMAAQLNAEIGINSDLAGDALPARDPHRNAPRPQPGCLYGLVGDVARAASKANQEVNEHAAALAYMTVLAAGLGRGCYLSVGDDWHHPRLFALHVGRSGRGRKGTSTKLATRILRKLEELHPEVAFQSHNGGQSSREGLAMKIHDGFKEGKNDVEPIHDKRLWVLESEFANTLHQTRRDGNTLSAALRDAWDGTGIKPATKTAPISATKPHINLLGHITPTELVDLMKARELSNGFANRFIVIWAEQPGLDAMPGFTSEEDLEVLVERTAEVLRFAQADRFAEGDHTRMELSIEARERYKKVYRDELQDRAGGERIAGLLIRRAPYLLRLAMLFALTDKSYRIELHHLDVALHWIRYWVDSVRFIFASAEEEERSEKVRDTGRRILEHIDTFESASRTDLMSNCFQGHITKDLLDAALDDLLKESPPAIEVEVRARTNGRGSGTKIYRRPSANPANSAKRVVSVEENGEGNERRTVRTVRNVEAASHIDPQDFADFAVFAQHAELSQEPAQRHTSQNSQTSHVLSASLVDEVSGDDVEVF